MSAISLQDGFGGDDELPEAVTRLGKLPLAALAALVLHLRRLRAVDEFAGYAALVSPYEVQLICCPQRGNDSFVRQT